MDEGFAGFDGITIEVHPACYGIETVHKDVAACEHSFSLGRETAHVRLNMDLGIDSTHPFCEDDGLGPRIPAADLFTIDILAVEVGLLRTVGIHYDEMADPCGCQSGRDIGSEASASDQPYTGLSDSGLSLFPEHL